MNTEKAMMIPPNTNPDDDEHAIDSFNPTFCLSVEEIPWNCTVDPIKNAMMSKIEKILSVENIEIRHALCEELKQMISHYGDICKNVFIDSMEHFVSKDQTRRDELAWNIRRILQENLTGVAVDTRELLNVIRRLIDTSQFDIIQTNSSLSRQVNEYRLQKIQYENKIRSQKQLIKVMTCCLVVSLLICILLGYHGITCKNSLREMTQKLSIGSELAKGFATALKIVNL